MLDKIKEFGPASWSIDNRTSIYILTIFILLAGGSAYVNMPKEQFPEVIFPQMMVNTIYPGTSPENMESLVSKHIEKQCKSITGVKKITSNSIQDFSSVMVEFNTNVDVALAKQKVKDAVDKARSNLPNDLPKEPSVIEIDISQTPIMNINLSGDFDLDKLKRYADALKDRIEGMKEITRVDLIGALEREIQINVDMYKMEANMITMRDIESAVSYENMTISGGAIDMGSVKRQISVKGTYKDSRIIGDIVIRGGTGALVHVRDIADVVDTHKERESFAHLDGKNVITLNVIKRSGENLIKASDDIRAACAEMKQTVFPKGLKITITGDQSARTKLTLHDLTNTIIIGFILVTVILMFFMGVTNAIFVALSVPISMGVALLIEPSFFVFVLGRANFSLNFIVMFSFLLALGIVVDDAIVVIENTHRIFDNGKVPIKQAAKLAAGEVFLPVLSGTLTTLAPFFPLAFWQGIVGKFMFYLPITMIITLFASLVVAYIINPVFAVSFMKPHVHEVKKSKFTRGLLITSIVFTVIAVLSYAMSNRGLGNFTVFIYFLYLLNEFVLTGMILTFQEKIWPAVQNGYAKMMTFFLKGYKPAGLLIATVLLLFFSFFLVAKFPPNIVFFPKADPNFAYTYITLPVGTNQVYTDSVAKEVEKRIFKVIGQNNPLVESVITNVAVGANDPTSFDVSASPHKAKVTVAFVAFEERHGKSTQPYLNQFRDAVKGIPETQITVEQESGGPPTGKAISVEITGDDFNILSKTVTGLKRHLDALQIAGVEELKSDLVLNKPELIVDIDRERANREGISTAQIGSGLRNAVFGKEISKFKDVNDEYPIMLRFKAEQRGNIDQLLNQKIIFRDMNMGGVLRNVPMSAIATAHYGNTYGGIKRKNQKRIVTLSSNVLTGFNPNKVVADVQEAIKGYNKPEGVEVRFGGEQDDQKESMGFLGGALLASIGLIMLILVIQFNSISKMVIILSEIIFSIIGVLLGFVFFRMDISIIMTGIGIIALAGIVVRNGILMVEFTDTLLKQGMELKTAIIEAGRTRMTPVLLTASATILGLVPLAVGLNMDFVTLFRDLDPHLFFGGDSVAFWGPLSWTMIYGLTFATFLTLILVPAMLLMSERLKMKLNKNYNPSAVEEAG
ncbi:MAG: hypothetical protein RIS64_2663 [Bacteroidota bacterium]|jgi:multidrug efflux pump subunit AcrB